MNRERGAEDVLARVQSLFRVYVLACITVAFLAILPDPQSSLQRAQVKYASLVKGLHGGSPKAVERSLTEAVKRTSAEALEASTSANEGDSKQCTSKKKDERPPTSDQRQFLGSCFRTVIGGVDMTRGERKKVIASSSFGCDGNAGRCTLGCTWIQEIPSYDDSLDRWLSYAANPNNTVVARYAVSGLIEPRTPEDAWPAKPAKELFGGTPDEIKHARFELDRHSCTVVEFGDETAKAKMELHAYGGDDEELRVGTWTIEFRMQRLASHSGADVLFPEEREVDGLYFRPLRALPPDLRQESLLNFGDQLENRLRNAGPTTQIFGVTLKVRHAIQLSAVFLLGLSVYFSIYLGRLRDYAIDQSLRSVFEASAWFPLFGRANLLLMVLVLVLLPVIATQPQALTWLLEGAPSVRPVLDPTMWLVALAMGGLPAFVSVYSLSEARALISSGPGDSTESKPLRVILVGPEPKPETKSETERSDETDPPSECDA